MLNSKEIVKVQSDLSLVKSDITLGRTLPLAFAAGLFVAIGAVTYSAIGAFSDVSDPMLISFISSLVFCFGIMACVITGSELFTSNCMSIIGVWDKRISLARYFKGIFGVYIFNALGAALVVLLVYYGNVFGEAGIASHIARAEAKVSLGFIPALSKGIITNILVCAGAWFAASSDNTWGKMVGSAVPVYTFLIIGTEHCVANFYFIPMGMLYGANVSIYQLFVDNLLPVTIGNIIGGVLFAFLFYQGSYKYEKLKS